MNPASHAERRMAVAARRGARQDLPGQDGLAALHHRRRRAAHQLPVRDRRPHDHLRDHRLSDQPGHGRRGRRRAASPQRAGFRAGRPDRRRRRQRDRHLRRPADLCRAPARARTMVFSRRARRPRRRDQRDAARRGRAATSSATEARIGRLGIGRAAPREFAPPAAPSAARRGDRHDGRHRRDDGHRSGPGDHRPALARRSSAGRSRSPRCRASRRAWAGSTSSG